MNQYVVYTTEGFTAGPNTDIDVGNCQLLGTIEGCSEEDAIKRLFEQDEWIQKAGFSMNNAIAHPLLTKSIQEDIKNLVEYLWEDEHRHFQENNDSQDHIFYTIKRLKDIL